MYFLNVEVELSTSNLRLPFYALFIPWFRAIMHQQAIKIWSVTKPTAWSDWQKSWKYGVLSLRACCAISDLSYRNGFTGDTWSTHFFCTFSHTFPFPFLLRFGKKHFCKPTDLCVEGFVEKVRIRGKYDLKNIEFLTPCFQSDTAVFGVPKKLKNIIWKWVRIMTASRCHDKEQNIVFFYIFTESRRGSIADCTYSVNRI